MGNTLIVFVQSTMPAPPAGSVIDHIGLSYADLGAKMQALAAAGVKILQPLRDHPRLFKNAFIEDPWGVRSSSSRIPRRWDSITCIYEFRRRRSA